MYLWIGLIFSLIFAGWTWFRPYDWKSDPVARGKIAGAQVRQDRSYYWLDIHVKIPKGMQHDLEKPVRLITASNSSMEPADTTLAGKPGQPITEIWFRFWLEKEDFAESIRLKINDGTLVVRKGVGLPKLGTSGQKYYTSSNW